MRKILLILSFLCVLLLPSPVSFAEIDSGQVQFISTRVEGECAVLYAEPDTDSDIIGRYYSGTQVTLLSKVDNCWAYVRVGSTGCLDGYMESRYLETEASHALPAYRATASSWELYSAPSAGCSSQTYGIEDQVVLLGFSDSWWHIRIGNDTGFVNAFPIYLNQTSTEYWSGFQTAFIANPDSSDRLHLREKPSKSSKSLGKYYNGVIVALIEKTNIEWYKIRVGNLEGYMMTEFLSTDFSSYETTMPVCTINNRSGTGLNLRADQDTSSKSFGLLQNGTSVTILGLTEKWCHVTSDGQVGFMLLIGFENQISYNKSSTIPATRSRTAIITETCSLYRTTSPNDDDVLTTLEPGDKIVVLQAESRWYKVKFHSMSGYVDSSKTEFE